MSIAVHVGECIWRGNGVALMERVSEVDDFDLGWVYATQELVANPSRDAEDTLDPLVTQRPFELRLFREGATPPLGLYGLALANIGERWRPAVVIAGGIFDGTFGRRRIEVTRLEASPIKEVLARLGVDPHPDAVVIEIPRPSESYAFVEADLFGTLGLPVQLPDGRRGALTAGHVAGTAGTTVNIGNVLQGTVEYTYHRGLHPYPGAIADVAVLSLGDDWKTRLALPSIAGLADLAELDTVTAHTRSGAGAAGQAIRAVQDRFALDKFGGVWTDVALVDAAISEPGDSGALVVNSSGKAVGQVVAGHPPAYSIVQDIDVLLSDSNTVPDI